MTSFDPIDAIVDQIPLNGTHTHTFRNGTVIYWLAIESLVLEKSKQKAPIAYIGGMLEPIIQNAFALLLIPVCVCVMSCWFHHRNQLVIDRERPPWISSSSSLTEKKLYSKKKRIIMYLYREKKNTFYLFIYLFISWSRLGDSLICRWWWRWWLAVYRLGCVAIIGGPDSKANKQKWMSKFSKDPMNGSMISTTFSRFDDGHC